MTDTATIVVIATAVCTVITALSVAIVKILDSLKEMRVALIAAAASTSRIEKSTDGNLSAMRDELTKALAKVEALQFGATPPGVTQEVKVVNPPEDPANVKPVKPIL